MIQQLSLFGDSALPRAATYDIPFSWADGDTCDLERLAALLKVHPRSAIDRPGGTQHIVRILDTRVDSERGCVMATCVEDIELEQELGMKSARAVEADDAEC